MLIGLDLDGTLLDSRLRHAVALRRAAEALAAPLPERDVQAYLRLKCDGCSGVAALRQLGVQAAEEISQRWVEIIESEEMLALDQLYPDTLDALGCQWSGQNEFALVTGRQNPEAARRQIIRMGMESFFCEVIVVDPRDHSQSKAAVTSHLDFGAIAGDTEIDLKWAMESNAGFYASSYGFRSPDYWNRRQIASYASLSAILQAIAGQDQAKL
jgi:phosphoglycolate phosphatase-like HAD superfamily hydrolase